MDNRIDSSSAVTAVSIEKVKLVQFEGDDDPWDPKNFSSWKRWIILLVVAHGAVVVTCTSSIYVLSLRSKIVNLDCFLWSIGISL
jgi:hypothetical protein